MLYNKIKYILKKPSYLTKINKMKKFQRKKEDFVCENCGTKVKGNGYTNHCPVCLYSKHVDINPGDRLSNCHGLMIPEDFEIRNGGYIIIHRCLKCGLKKKNKFSKADNLEVLLMLSKKEEGLPSFNNKN